MVAAGITAADVGAWGTLLLGVGTVGALLDRRTRAIERKVEDTHNVASELHPKVDEVTRLVGSHDEQIAQLRLLASLARPFMDDWERRYGPLSEKEE